MSVVQPLSGALYDKQELKERNPETQHNEIQYNDTQHNNTQHKGIICDMQHNDIQHNNSLPLV
jgi:hypothetical protein